MRKIALLTLVFGMLLVGCGQAAPAASPPSTSGPAAQASPQQTAAPPPARATLTSAPPTEASAPQPTEASVPAATPGASPAVGGPGTSVRPPDELVSAAQSQLAKQLGVPADSLMLQSANSKQWPNPGLGCPQRGAIYPQIVTDGFLLIFSDKSQSQTYDVHTGLTPELMVWCKNNQPIDLSMGAGASSAPTAEGNMAQPDATSQPLVASAQQALAKDIGVPESAIKLVGLEAVDWSDSSLGCPKPGENYLQVITPGYRVTLEAQGKTYEYHTDKTTRAVRCDKG
jgi:hypothetical protein